MIMMKGSVTNITIAALNAKGRDRSAINVARITAIILHVSTGMGEVQDRNTLLSMHIVNSKTYTPRLRHRYR